LKHFFILVLAFIVYTKPPGVKQESSFLFTLIKPSVDFVDFRVNAVGDSVEIKWSIDSEKAFRGFEVERKKLNSSFRKVGFIPRKADINDEYTFYDSRVKKGTYEYRLKLIGMNGEAQYSEAIQVDITKPGEFDLDQNYPNPFNPSTLISFTVSVDSKVTIRIYNILGQQIMTLLDEEVPAGTHEITFDSNAIPGGLESGLYIYKMDAKGDDGSLFTATRKMILTK
jgi:hypothetical protein